MAYYYTIDSGKLAEITRHFKQDIDPKANEDSIKAEICADWREGDEHQEWIDSAGIDEIVDWLASFYSK